jgi:D-cysteine desulfhydrase
MHPNEPPRIELAQLPTPVVEMPNLCKAAKIDRLLMKRDDLTGLELSGNKVRKLEYVVADAVKNGADTLVTHGGFQSNHCRATAAIGARLGLKVRMFLRAPSSDPDHDGNLFLDHLFGGHITYHTPQEYSDERKKLIDQAMSAERDVGRKPYFFPVGASVPIGCWGYIRCAWELAQQLERDTKVDVFVGVSSSGTLAGLMLGKALFDLDNWRMIGVPVSDSLEYFKKDVRDLVDQTNQQFELGLTPERTPIELIGGYIGEGYAIPYPRAVDAIKLLARTQGIVLDPTYTSKAMVGTIETIQRGGVRPGAVPVFIHTGGAFGLMARRDLFEKEQR